MMMKKGWIKKYTKGFEVLLFDVARTTQKSKREEEKPNKDKVICLLP